MACFALMNRAYWLLGLFIIILLGSARSTFRKSNEKDFLQNFVDDPRHCGQCEYDLTGNVSRICPECGWKIPDENLMTEDDSWAKWWKKWEIGYLEQPQKQLCLCACLTFMFIAVALGILILNRLSFSERTVFILVPPALLGVNFTINTIRVLAYIKKSRNSSPD